MKVYLSTTTGYYDDVDTPPVEEAVLLNPVREEWDDKLFGIEINTLEELVELMKKVNHPIILRHTYNDESYSPYELEIYDGYRE